MSLVADALQPYIVRELASLAGRARIGTLADIIVSETSAYDLLFDDLDRSLTLDFRETRPIIGAFAGDCCRFSFAAFQTISPAAAEIIQRDTVAWSLVKVYYAAFYAGHALIRIFGEACSFFDRQHVGRLTELGEALGREWSFDMDAGLYRCSLTPSSTAIKCIKTKGAAGIHEAFWTVFGVHIQRLSEATLTGALGSADARAVYAQLDALIEIMRRRTGYSWLSGVRNELQYRQSHGVWFPARLRQSERQSLGRLISNWQCDPMEIDLDMRRFGLLGDFVAACVFIVALCHTILARIGERSAAGPRSFVLLGPMAFVNDIEARSNGT
jgi:hypothetical protein